MRKGLSFTVSIVSLFLIVQVALAEDVTVPLGYTVGQIRISNTEPEGAALAIAPTDEHLLYATVGGFAPQKVVKIDLSQNPPLVSDFATGALNLHGLDSEDNALDSRFGNIGGLAVLHTGEVIIVDNNNQPGVPGDTIFIARDLNHDGDAMDVVAGDGGTTVSEVQKLIDPIETPPGQGWGGFSGQQAEVDAEDNVYIVTADGGGLGEVLRITHPATAPAINVWLKGLDYGAGLGFDSTGNLCVGNSSWPTGASVFRTKDLSTPPDGDALDGGESETLTAALSGIYDLSIAEDDTLYISNNRYIQKLQPESGQISDFAVFPLWTFLGDIVLTSQAKPFAPTAGTDQAMMIIADGNGDGQLTTITPMPSAAVFSPKWIMYE